MHFSILFASALLAGGALADNPAVGLRRRGGSWGNWGGSRNGGGGHGGGPFGLGNPFGGGLGGHSGGGSGGHSGGGSGAPAPNPAPAPAPSSAPAPSYAPPPAASSPPPAPPPAETSSSCTDSTEPEEDEPNCLDEDKIEQIMADSIYLLENPGISDYNTTAERLFTPEVQVVSDSLKVSNGQPIDGTPFFPSRSAITNAQFDLLPIRDMETVYYTYNCDDQTLGWRWTASGLADGHTRIATNMLFDFVDGRINHVYWEFNSINWVKNVGINCPVPQAS